MSVNNFKPTIWTAYLIESLKKVHVFASVANRQLEREITAFGEAIKINQIAALSTASYTENSTSITPSTLVDSQSVLSIDQQDYVAFKVDDVDKAQAKGNLLEAGMMESVYAINNTADAYLAGLYADAGIAQNSSSSPVDMTSLNVEDEILSVAEQMDDANIPRAGRFGVIPPWILHKLVLAGVSSLTDNVDTWKNGFVGRFGGFDLLVSTNVSKNSSSWDITRALFGIRGQSWAYAEQLLKTEAFRQESYFSDAIKMLHVYGGKFIRPDMTCVLYADKTAEA